jgi:hypothetical protein
MRPNASQCGLVVPLPSAARLQILAIALLLSVSSSASAQERVGSGGGPTIVQDLHTRKVLPDWRERLLRLATGGKATPSYTAASVAPGPMLESIPEFTPSSTAFECGVPLLPSELQRAVDAHVTNRGLCNTAAKRLLRIDAPGGGQHCKLLNPDLMRTLAAREQSEAVQRYAERCLTRYDAPGPDVGRRVSAAHQKAIETSVGVLSVADPLSCTQRRNKCVGLKLGKRIVTARHCVAWESGIQIGAPSYFFDDEAIKRIFDFNTIDGQMYKARLDHRLVEDARDGQLDFISKDYSKDWIVLEIISDISQSSKATIQPVSQSRKAPKILGKKFLFVSHQPYLRVLAESKSDTQYSLAGLVREALSFEYSPTCSVLHERRGILLHRCHTEVTMSGTPLLLLNGPHLEFVGIHTGAIAESELPDTPPACQSTSLTGASMPTAGRTFNHGIRLPSKLIELLSSQQ